jgi:arylsulfatase A-like enzyme
MEQKNMKRLDFVKLIGLTLTTGCSGSLRGKSPSAKQPNIIYILADDLGYAELGCYGQKKIKTPNIDKIAAEGMKFTQHYSGHSVCAPSRCTLATGLHTGHAYSRGNMGASYAGQLPIPPGTVTSARLMKKAGYKTAFVGKWGLGGPDTTGVPNKQGVDYFFGYLDQWRAHTYYPTYLYENDKKFKLNNRSFSAHQKLKELPEKKDYYKDYMDKDYTPDFMTAKALDFVRENKANPFFLTLAYPIPHVALQVPEKSLKQYKGKFPETPYLGEKGYLPHDYPRAAYAAMVSHMDRHVGRLMDLLKELNIDDDTVVIFSSDNGPTFNGGSDSDFFESAGPFRGLKVSFYEGGIRAPMIARWPGRIKAGTTSDHISAFWDVMPTVLELAGRSDLIPEDTDGISMVNELLRKGRQKKHEYLYWEGHGGKGGTKVVRYGDYKALAFVDQEQKEKKFELYDLASDIGEGNNIAEERPDIVKKIKRIMANAHTDSEHFNFGGYEPKREEFIQYLRKKGPELKEQDK